jgi:hypothetical protein
VAVGSTGCWTDVRPAPPEPLPRPGTVRQGDGEGEAPAAAATASPTASVVPEVSTEELEPPLPTIRFSDTSGASEDNVKRWFSETPSHFGHCKGLEDKTIHVYVSARRGDIYASLDKSDADAAATSCVLETIAFELDNAVTTSTSPSERANTVESLIILNW